MMNSLIPLQKVVDCRIQNKQIELRDLQDEYKKLEEELSNVKQTKEVLIENKLAYKRVFYSQKYLKPLDINEFDLRLEKFDTNISNKDIQIMSIAEELSSINERIVKVRLDLKSLYIKQEKYNHLKCYVETTK